MNFFNRTPPQIQMLGVKTPHYAALRWSTPFRVREVHLAFQTKKLAQRIPTYFLYNEFTEAAVVKEIDLHSVKEWPTLAMGI
jgi:hypothetical protein